MLFWKKNDKNEEKNSLTIVIGENSVLKSTKGSDSLFTVSTLNGKSLPVIGSLPLNKQYKIVGLAFMLFSCIFVASLGFGLYKKSDYTKIKQELSLLTGEVQELRGVLEVGKDGYDSGLIEINNKKEAVDNHLFFLRANDFNNIHSLKLTHEKIRLDSIINDWEKNGAGWDSLKDMTDHLMEIKTRSGDTLEGFSNLSLVLAELTGSDAIDNIQKDQIRKSMMFLDLARQQLNGNDINLSNISQVKSTEDYLIKAGEYLGYATTGGMKGKIENAQIKLSEIQSFLLPSLKRLEESVKQKNNLLAGLGGNLDSTNNSLLSFKDFIEERENSVIDYYYIAFGAAFTMIILLGVVWLLYNEENKRKTKEASDANEATQKAIFAIVEEIASLGEGDLQVRATVTEDITGTIADAINYAVTEMSDLVKDVQTTSHKITDATKSANKNAKELSTFNKDLVESVLQVKGSIKTIAESIRRVEKRINESKQVAFASVESSNKGLEAVNASIHGMRSIEDNVVETGRRIERLTTQSNQISEVVDLIKDISEKTSVLAINATVQAAKAGSAGKGFQVVADAVQDLASQAANATKRIVALIQAVQTDINGAGAAMERTKEEARSGVRVAETTGDVLGEINAVSKQLSGIVADLNEQVTSAAKSIISVSDTMNTVADATKSSQQATTSSTKSIALINDLAESLKDSVTKFKV